MITRFFPGLTIPRSLRRLFERERALLGLLSRTGYEVILKSFRALFVRDDVRPGCVISIQTHGTFGANFNPHLHGIISDGVFTLDGEFLPLPSLDTAPIAELFPRLLLARLHQADRLSESFMSNLLSWVHPGFSVFAGPPVQSASSSLQSQARYITRPALAMDALQKGDDGTLAMHTPPDPHTGSTMVVFDPWSGSTAHIPDPGRHCQRYYGAYSNRAKTSGQRVQDFAEVATPSCPADEDSNFAGETRRTWARLLRKIFEVIPSCVAAARA